MKKQFSSFAVSAVILSAAAISNPVETPVRKNETAKIEKVQATSFAFFRTHRQGKGITASWGLTSNAGVVGFSVQRTYEDPNDPYSEWTEVASGVCDGSRSYKCTDANVSPGFINYRVVAQMDDGTKVESAISTVHIISR